MPTFGPSSAFATVCVGLSALWVKRDSALDYLGHRGYGSMPEATLPIDQISVPPSAQEATDGSVWWSPQTIKLSCFVVLGVLAIATLIYVCLRGRCKPAATTRSVRFAQNDEVYQGGCTGVQPLEAEEEAPSKLVRSVDAGTKEFTPAKEMDEVAAPAMDVAETEEDDVDAPAKNPEFVNKWCQAHLSPSPQKQKGKDLLEGLAEARANKVLAEAKQRNSPAHPKRANSIKGVDDQHKIDQHVEKTMESARRRKQENNTPSSTPSKVVNQDDLQAVIQRAHQEALERKSRSPASAPAALSKHSARQNQPMHIKKLMMDQFAQDARQRNGRPYEWNPYVGAYTPTQESQMVCSPGRVAAVVANFDVPAPCTSLEAMGEIDGDGKADPQEQQSSESSGVLHAAAVAAEARNTDDGANNVDAEQTLMDSIMPKDLFGGGSFEEVKDAKQKQSDNDALSTAIRRTPSPSKALARQARLTHARTDEKGADQSVLETEHV